MASLACAGVLVICPVDLGRHGKQRVQLQLRCKQPRPDRMRRSRAKQGPSRQPARMMMRSLCPSNPATTMPCALLLMAYIVQRSAFAGFEGSHGTNPPPRPPTIPGLNLRGREGTGGEEARRGGVDNEGRGKQGAIPPSMYTRVDADGSRFRPPLGSTKSTNSNRNNNDGVSTAAGDGGLASRGTSPSSSSSSSSTWQNNPGSFAGAANGCSICRVSNGHHQIVAAARQRALSASGRSAGGLRPVLFNHRAGGGGGGVGGTAGDQEPGYYQYEGGQDGEEYADDARVIDDNRDGMLAEDGVPRMSRTPLQEQVHHDQDMQRPPALYPGQAPGTQPRASSLFRRAGGGAVFFVFFILVWRSLSNYEHVEQMSGFMRHSMYIPAIALFLGNVVCMCLSLVQSATTRQKARMKTMLTIDAVAEGVLLTYNLLRLLGGSGEAQIAREEFISRLLANAWFLSVCFTFAKARWVADGAW